MSAIGLTVEGVIEWNQEVLDRLDGKGEDLESRVSTLASQFFEEGDLAANERTAGKMSAIQAEFTVFKDEITERIEMATEAFKPYVKRGFGEGDGAVLEAYQLFLPVRRALLGKLDGIEARLKKQVTTVDRALGKKESEQLRELQQAIDQAVANETLAAERQPLLRALESLQSGHLDRSQRQLLGMLQEKVLVEGWDLVDDSLASSPVSSPLDLQPMRQGSKVLENYRFQEVTADGNCLFYATSLALQGDESAHRELREACCDNLAATLSEWSWGAGLALATPVGDQGVKEYFEGWLLRTAEAAQPDLAGRPRREVIAAGRDMVVARVGEDPAALYMEFMRQNTSHGGEVEIAALARHLQRPVLVFRSDEKEGRIEPDSLATLFGEEFAGPDPIVLLNQPGHYSVYLPK